MFMVRDSFIFFCYRHTLACCCRLNHRMLSCIVPTEDECGLCSSTLVFVLCFMLIFMSKWSRYFVAVE